MRNTHILWELDEHAEVRFNMDEFLKENDLLKVNETIFGKDIYNDSVKLGLHKFGDKYFATTQYIRLENKAVNMLSYTEDTIQELLYKFIEDCKRHGIPYKTLNSLKFIKDL